MRMHTKDHWEAGLKVDMAGIAARYRDAKRDNNEDYQKAVRIGKLGTLRGSMNMTTFGTPCRQQRRSVAQIPRWMIAMGMQAFGPDAANHSLTIAQRGMRAGLGATDVLSAANRAARVQKQQQRAAEDLQSKALAHFRATTGADIVRGVKRSMSDLQSYHMVGRPGLNGVVVEVELPSCDEVGRCVS